MMGGRTDLSSTTTLFPSRTGTERSGTVDDEDRLRHLPGPGVESTENPPTPIGLREETIPGTVIVP